MVPVILYEYHNASIKVSVLGNISLQTKNENPDLVKNISTTDVDVLGHPKANGAIIKRCSERNHHAMVMSML